MWTTLSSTQTLQQPSDLTESNESNSWGRLKLFSSLAFTWVSLSIGVSTMATPGVETGLNEAVPIWPHKIPFAGRFGCSQMTHIRRAQWILQEGGKISMTSVEELEPLHILRYYHLKCFSDVLETVFLLVFVLIQASRSLWPPWPLGLLEFLLLPFDLFLISLHTKVDCC